MTGEEVSTYRTRLGLDIYSSALTTSACARNRDFPSALCSISNSASHRRMAGAICKGFWEKSALCPPAQERLFWGTVTSHSELQRARGNRPDTCGLCPIKNALVSLSFSFVLSTTCQLQMSRFYL